MVDIVMPAPPQLPDNADELLGFINQLIRKKHVGRQVRDSIQHEITQEVLLQLDRANERYDLKLPPAREFWQIGAKLESGNLNLQIEPRPLLNYEVRVEPATNTAKWMPEGTWKASVHRTDHGELFVMAPTQLQAIVALARLVEARHG